MSKKGMKRPEIRTHSKNNVAPVPELQGRAKLSNERANPIIAGTESPELKVYHAKPHSGEKPIASVYKEIDTDLARDNLENDITAADLQDM